ncbi:MAG: DUF3575 domain-containing protein [Alistipes sp.]|nr:DUF3575 domain-containing protein [Alistipes sp.]
MKRFIPILITLIFASVAVANAQKVAVKTNALAWASTTPNVGFEFAMGDRWTVEVSGAYNPWTFNKEKNVKMKHWLASPEFRYWFCESFQGHFIGINGNYTRFNMSGIPLPNAFINLHSTAPTPDNFRDVRLAGWAVGAGLTYGYAFPIARRWNMELTAGFGWWYTRHDQFESRKCGMFQQAVERHALGITSLGISFIYLIK